MAFRMADAGIGCLSGRIFSRFAGFLIFHYRLMEGARDFFRNPLHTGTPPGVRGGYYGDETGDCGLTGSCGKPRFDLRWKAWG